MQKHNYFRDATCDASCDAAIASDLIDSDPCRTDHNTITEVTAHAPVSISAASRPNSLVDPIAIEAGSDVSESSLQSHCHVQNAKHALSLCLQSPIDII